MNLLFVSRTDPGERQFGSDTRTVRVLQHLRDVGHRVHFVRLSRRSLRQPPTSKCRELCASYHALAVSGCSTNAVQPRSWKRFTRPRTLVVQRYWDSMRRRGRSLGEQIESHLRQTQSSVLWVDHVVLAPVASYLPPMDNVLRVIDTHDVMHLRDASLRSAGLATEHDVSSEDERRLLLPYDVIVAIQDQEATEYRQILPEHRVITVGHAAAIDPQPCHTLDVCFVGSEYVVNEHCLRQFLDEIWPGVRAACPQTNLQVVGGVCHCRAILSIARQDNRVILRGPVPNVSDIYAGPAVVICPLWAGSGLKIKMVEALAHGKAMVATPVAAQGLEDGIGSAFEMADRPAEFIDALVRVVRDDTLRRRLERSAADYAARKFSSQNVWHEMNDYLRLWRDRQRPFQRTSPNGSTA